MWPFRKKRKVETYQPSAKQVRHFRNFVAAEQNRLTFGWDTQSSSINSYLRTNLTALRARSREQVRNNPFAKRFISLMKSNVIGPKGVQIQAQTKRFTDGQLVLDEAANDVIEAAWADWGHSQADAHGRMTWVEIQNLALATIACDGELLFQKRFTGKYGFRLRMIDPERLDVTRNQDERNGNRTCLGVEYTESGDVAAYWVRDVDPFGEYHRTNSTRYPAREMMHIFRPDWVDQVRGIPWMAAALYGMKMLDGYDEAAITAARVGAAKMGFFTSETGEAYTGDDKDAQGNTISEAEPGSFEQLANGTTFQAFDPNYPHEQYPHFVKATLRRLSSGLDLSYPTLGNDLEGVNYSSIRAGVLEDRELFKQLQNWFIAQFVRPVYEEWVRQSVLRGAIKIGNRPLARPVTEYYAANYQGRRWSWVDPEKDMRANELAIKHGIRSRGAIIRDLGDDPDTVWREIQKEREQMAGLGLSDMYEETENDEIQG